MDKLLIAYERLKEKQESLEPYLPIRTIAETLGVGKDTAKEIITQLIKEYNKGN